MAGLYPGRFDYAGRIIPPFVGQIEGIRLGLSKAEVMEKLGKPVPFDNRILAPNLRDVVMYYLDDVTTARFIFEKDELSTIHLLK